MVIFRRSNNETIFLIFSSSYATLILLMRQLFCKDYLIPNCSSCSEITDDRLGALVIKKLFYFFVIFLKQVLHFENCHTIGDYTLQIYKKYHINLTLINFLDDDNFSWLYVGSNQLFTF